jgi:hypothetical protein
MPPCAHLCININGIERAYSAKTRRRTVRGQCRQCMNTVLREESKTGLPLNEWRRR